MTPEQFDALLDRHAHDEQFIHKKVTAVGGQYRPVLAVFHAHGHGRVAFDGMPCVHTMYYSGWQIGLKSQVEAVFMSYEGAFLDMDDTVESPVSVDPNDPRLVPVLIVTGGSRVCSGGLAIEHNEGPIHKLPTNQQDVLIAAFLEGVLSARQ